jgi:hypothetical protein
MIEDKEQVTAGKLAAGHGEAVTAYSWCCLGNNKESHMT